MWSSARPDYEMLALEGSFHGRTMGALSATMQAKYQTPFQPLLPGFRALPRNDLDALHAAFSERTAAILLEPIQGEGGASTRLRTSICARRARYATATTRY
jgi:acetylornithine/N-succinyldiaminopimelate aminotransferase